MQVTCHLHDRRQGRRGSQTSCLHVSSAGLPLQHARTQPRGMVPARLQGVDHYFGRCDVWIGVATNVVLNPTQQRALPGSLPGRSHSRLAPSPLPPGARVKSSDGIGNRTSRAAGGSSARQFSGDSPAALCRPPAGTCAARWPALQSRAGPERHLHRAWRHSRWAPPDAWPSMPPLRCA